MCVVCMKGDTMSKLCNVYDSLCDVKKFFYGISVLLDQDPDAMNDDEFNSWLGCLFVNRDLLDQTLKELEFELKKVGKPDDDC